MDNLKIDEIKQDIPIKSNSPKISVLMPAYNGEQYLRRALDSAINQTCKDFELIIIDDGSTDGTLSICNEYGEKYDYVHVFHQNNIGSGKTRERLLENASGEYIFWLDQDDYIDETLLEKALRAFEDEEADLVAFGGIELTSHGENKSNHIDDIGIEKWRKINIWGLMPMMWQYASRRQLWENFERFPDDIRVADDVWLSSQIIPRAKRIVSLGECLYYYDRTNMNSISHAYTGKGLSEQAISSYRVFKRNSIKYENNLTLGLRRAIRRLIEAYCVNCVRSSMTDYQKKLVRSALQDLIKNYSISGARKYYWIYLCIVYGGDFICKWYGKNKIRRYERSQK